ncbi:MAG: dihydrolipoyl dehydrogenase [Desulfobacterales bacterium]|nr:MAG: dihydrolipoyl dehydrogenase [Desulfobacterales bacterium]
MSVDVVIPVIGKSVKKGKILEWLKQEGEPVAQGEPIVVVEAEKVSVEIEAPASGILAQILVEAGLEVPIGTRVALIAREGEELAALPAAVAEAERSAVRPREPVVSAGVGQAPAAGAERHILIIGGGSGGYMAAIKAAQMGARVTLVEKAKIGGTCLHTGCMPTKSYLARAKVLEQIKRLGVFKGQEGVAIDMKKMAAVKNEAVAELETGLNALLASHGVNIIKGTAQFADPKQIRTQTADGQVRETVADSVIIATGARPFVPPGIKIDGKYVHTTDTIWNVKKVPRRVLIVGSGAVGVEFASIFNSLGSKVAVIEMLPQAMPYLDQEIAAELRGYLEDRGITIRASTQIMAAEQQRTMVEAVLRGPAGENKSAYDLVLIAAGRVPVTEGLNLEKVGIQVEKGGIKVNARMETTATGVYAVGDAVGGLMLAHAAFMEALVAVENIMGGVREADYAKVPNCIYSFPEFGSVGLTEDEARRRGGEVSVGRFPIYANGKARVSGDTEGMVKIIADMSTGEILGVHILCDHATELIGEYALAMTSEVTIEEAALTIKGHPTLSESLTEAAMTLTGGACHLPKN